MAKWNHWSIKTVKHLMICREPHFPDKGPMGLSQWSFVVINIIKWVTPTQGALLDVSPDWGKLITLAPRIQLWNWLSPFLHGDKLRIWESSCLLHASEIINSRYSTLHWSTTVKIPGWQNLETTKIQVLCLYFTWWDTNYMNIQGLPLQKFLII